MHLPTQQTPEVQVQSRGRADPLEKGMATHSSILAWDSPTDKGAWRATVRGGAKGRTELSTHAHGQRVPV